MRFPIKNLKSILTTNSLKNYLKQKKQEKNLEVKKLFDYEYIPFILLLQDGKLDLIAPNYQIYRCFQSALEEILKHRKNLSVILKNIEE